MAESIEALGRRLRVAAEQATPGRRRKPPEHLDNGRYLMLDDGQLAFRVEHNGDREHIAAFDRETCLRLLALVEAADAIVTSADFIETTVLPAFVIYAESDDAMTLNLRRITNTLHDRLAAWHAAARESDGFYTQEELDRFDAPDPRNAEIARLKAELRAVGDAGCRIADRDDVWLAKIGERDEENARLKREVERRHERAQIRRGEG